MALSNLMTQPKFDKIDSITALPSAQTALDGFAGAALHVDSLAQVTSLNPPGAALMATLSDGALSELANAGLRAISAGAMRLERLNGPFPGESSDAIILNLEQDAGALVLIATNPAESAMRRALIESRQRYRDLVEISSDFIWETDRHGRFVFMSGAGALGHSTRDMLGRHSSDFVVDASPLPFPVFQAREPVVQTDVWLHRADGSISCQAITAVPIFDSEGIWCGTRGTARDVTEQRAQERAERQRLLRDRLMAYLINTISREFDPEKTLPTALSGIGLAIGATGGMIINGAPDSPSYDLLDWGEALAVKDFPEVRTALVEQGWVDIMRNGRQIIGHVTLDTGPEQPQVNGAIVFWGGSDGSGFDDSDREIIREVAGQVAQAIRRLIGYREIVAQSNLDALTGLMNRRAVLQKIDQRLKRAGTTGGTGVLAFIDVNNLKTQNDVGGHGAGDSVLTALGEILANGIGSGDLAGRIGGDEFVIWFDNATETTVNVRLETLLLKCRPITALSVDTERPVGLSIGAVCFRGSTPVTLSRLLERADAAMYEAKRAADRERRYVVVAAGAPVVTTPANGTDTLHNAVNGNTANGARSRSADTHVRRAHRDNLVKATQRTQSYFDHS
jgi:diguanylate cyclase (GGDEF)-like protein/PAS domain S-box-containing protein